MENATHYLLYLFSFNSWLSLFSQTIYELIFSKSIRTNDYMRCTISNVFGAALVSAYRPYNPKPRVNQLSSKNLSATSHDFGIKDAKWSKARILTPRLDYQGFDITTNVFACCNNLTTTTMLCEKLYEGRTRERLRRMKSQLFHPTHQDLPGRHVEHFGK